MNSSRPPVDPHRAELEEIIQSVSKLELNFGKIKLHLNELFQVDPKWARPLLTTPQGRFLLTQMEFRSGPTITTFCNALGHDDFMLFCLAIQTSAVAETFGPTDLSPAFSLLEKMPGKLIVKAILHYMHPDQADALGQLRASLPTAIPPMRQSNVPPAALPFLFPTIDTTQFTPQFGWFFYLLTKFSPVTEQAYKTALASFINAMMQPNTLLTLKPGMAFDKSFVHNNSINSYQELLHTALPHILPTLSQQDQDDSKQPSLDSQQPQPLLFPYFPKGHFITRPIASKQEFTALLSNPTDDFMRYFNFMFIIGPALHSETFLISFTSALRVNALNFPLRTQIFVYYYRAWCAKNKAATSHSTPLPAPPDFSRDPLGLLQLTILPAYTQHPNHGMRPTDECLVSRLMILLPLMPIRTELGYRILFAIVRHCFPDQAQCDEVLERVVEALFVYEEPHDALFRFSCALYQNGHTTIHQYVHRAVSRHLHETQVSSEEEPAPLPVGAFLMPLFHHFQRAKNQTDNLVKHITLCVHAGFLAPFPAPRKGKGNYDNNDVDSDVDDLGDEVEDDTPTLPSTRHHATVFHTCLVFRAVLYSFLLRFTGFTSYFPQSTQLLAQAVGAIGTYDVNAIDGLLVGEMVDRHDLPFLPPHFDTLLDPRDAIPTLQAALVDDDGKLHAVEYQDEPSPQEDSYVQGWGPFSHINRLIPQGAPRHQHIFHESVVAQLGTCIRWDNYDLEEHPQLDELAASDSLPPKAPQMMPDDEDWINSELNEATLMSAETRQLQKDLTQYYQKKKEIETNMVITQMQKVLLKAEQAGLFDVSIASSKRKLPPQASDSPTTVTAPTSPSPLAQKPGKFQPRQLQRNTYPLPDIPDVPEFNFDPISNDEDDKTYSKPRGMLFFDKTSKLNCFYDYNYCKVQLTTSINPDWVKDGAHATLFNNGRVVDNFKSFSVLEFFRQRSNWALELLIVGCLGLNVAPSPSSGSVQGTVTADLPSPMSSMDATTDQSASYQATRIQYCKDIALKHLPNFHQTLQPAPLVNLPIFTKPPNHDEDDFDANIDEADANNDFNQQSHDRMTLFQDTFAQLPLLTTLPLHDTLATLPSSTPPPLGL